jgi:hypothetical protein
MLEEVVRVEGEEQAENDSRAYGVRDRLCFI